MKIIRFNSTVAEMAISKDEIEVLILSLEEVCAVIEEKMKKNGVMKQMGSKWGHKMGS